MLVDVEPSFSIKSPDDALVAELSQTLGVHPVTARCLVVRGVHDEALAKAFLEPRLAGLRPPLGLAGLPEALERLAQAAITGEKVGVFGDYDVDGVTTAALLSEAFESFGIQVEARVASREAGYGFGVAQAKELVDAGCSLIVTGDCGTSDIDAIEHARERGVPTIIIDHHTVPSADAPHPSFALINPFRADSEFPFQGMASVGLAFYVMGALRTELRKRGHFATRPEPDVCSWLDLVALGTVADLVPLSHENRIMVTEGLRRLSLRTRPGVRALLEVAGVGPSDLIDERTIGWKLGPRLNAPGRLGDAQAALDVLRSRDRYQAEAAARLIETINTERRSEQDKVLVEALAKLEGQDPGPAVVVAGKGWAHGVVGIIASRLVEQYQRPAVVIAIHPETGEGRGSARSYGGVNLYRALHDASEHLGRFGGHAAAAGLTMRADDIDVFREQFHKAVVAQAPEQYAAFQCDAEVDAHEVDDRLATELISMAPFGKGNEEPLLFTRSVKVVESRRVGGDGSHLKLTIDDGKGRELSAIAFGLGDKDPGAGATIDLAFVPSLSTWSGRPRLEFTVKELWTR